MKLLISRDQRQGALGLGKIVFKVSFRADITEEEREALKKYKLGDTVLYERNPTYQGWGLGGRVAAAVLNAIDVKVTVKDLAEGKSVECKDIIEMLAIEEQVREAGKVFHAVLHAAKNFGGEETVDLAA